MKRYEFNMHRWRWAAAISLVIGAAACDNGANPPAATAGSTFKSFKPAGKGSGTGGGGKSASLGAEAGNGTPTAGGAAQDTKVKVEQGDVARVVGTNLYVLNQWRGLQVVDLSSAAAPKLTAKVPMTGEPREMYADDKEAVVIVAQVAELKDDNGKPVAQSGSFIRRVQLGAAPKEIASLPIKGYAALSKKVGDKLVLVVPQTTWNPWFMGCYGPYGCGAMASGTATDVAVGAKSSGGAPASGSGGASTGTAGGASIAYPGGGYGGGWQADKTLVVVVDLAVAGKLSVVGQVEIAGGVLNASIDAGQVLIASQDYAWAGSGSTVTERLSEVQIGGDGAPKLGAVSEIKADLPNNGSYASLVQADGAGAGRLALVRQQWNGSDGYNFALEAWQAKAGKWQKTAELAKKGLGYGSRVAIEDGVALWASSTSKPGVGAEDPGGNTPPKAGFGIDVIDLSNAATLAVTGHADAATGGYDIYGLQLRSLKNGLWLVGHRGDNWDQAQIETLDLADMAKPKWAGKIAVNAAYGLLADVVAPDVLAVAVMGSNGADKAGGPANEQAGVQLVSVDSQGALAKRGVFQSDFVYWYQLKNLLNGKTLLRIASAGLEVVDVANLDKPAKLGALDLAAEVQDAVQAGDRLVALVQGWKDGKTSLRVLAAGGTDDLNPDGKLDVQNGYGKLYANGNMVYLADGTGVRVFDVSDPKAPKARGSWLQPAEAYNPGNSTWWNTYDMAQSGSTLYATTSSVKYTVKTGKACESSMGNGTAESTPPSSGGGSGGGSSGSSGSGSAGVPAQADGSSGAFAQNDAGSSDQKPDSPDAGSNGKTDTPPDYVPTCYVDPVFSTKVVAIDLSNPDQPKLGGEVSIAGASWTQNPQVVGSKLVLTHYKSVAGTDGQWWGEYYLDRIDIAKPAAPKLIDAINVPGWLVGVASDGNSAVTLDWQPQKGSKPDDNKIENVLVAVKLAGGKASVVKQLALPDQVGATLRHNDAVYVSTWPYWWNWPAAESNGQPAKAPETKLLVFDAKVPEKLSQVAAIDAGAGVAWLAATGDNVFAQLSNGLGATAWNVAAPSQPKFAGFLATQGYWSPRVVVQGTNAYVPSGWYGVQAFALKP